MRKRRISLGANGLPIGWKVVGQREGYALVVIPSRDLLKLKELRIILEPVEENVEDSPPEISLRRLAKLRTKQGKYLYG